MTGSSVWTRIEKLSKLEGARVMTKTLVIFGTAVAEWELAAVIVVVVMFSLLVITISTQAWMKSWTPYPGPPSPPPRQDVPVTVSEEASARTMEPLVPQPMPPSPPRQDAPVMELEEVGDRPMEPSVPQPALPSPPPPSPDVPVMVLREVGGRAGGVWLAIVNAVGLMALPFLGLSLPGGLLWIIANQILLAEIVLVRRRRTFVVVKSTGG